MEMKLKPTIYDNFEVNRICMGPKVVPDGIEGPYSQLREIPIRRLVIPWDANHYQLFDCIWSKDRVFWKGIEEFTLYDPVILPGRPVPEEEMLRDMSRTYWVFASIILSQWAAEIQLEYFADLDTEATDAWEVVKQSVMGDGKIIDKPPDFQKLAYIGNKIPSLKIIEAKAGNAEEHVKKYPFVSRVIDSDWYTPKGCKRLVDLDNK